MWKKLQKTQYFISFSKEYEIFITDYITVWASYYSTQTFLTCLQKSNVGLEIDTDELLKKGKQILQKPNEVRAITTSLDGEQLNVCLTVSYGFPVRLKLKLSEGCKELFFDKVTQPLLKTICDLQASQNTLRSLLQKKDKEIEEYKCEGGEIALRHLKTVPYNDAVHIQYYNVYNQQFGTADFPEDLLNISVDRQPNKMIVKQEAHVPIANVESATPVKNEDIKIEPGESQADNVSPKRETIKIEPRQSQHDSSPRKKLKTWKI